MRLFKTREFARIARKERLPDRVLAEAVERAELGLVDARIGRLLIKQRIAREGQGRRGGYRSIIVHVQGARAVFLHLFAKNDQATLTPAEEEVYREAAKHIGQVGEQTVEALLAAGEWFEIEAG